MKSLAILHKQLLTEQELWLDELSRRLHGA
jgi:hypothetical protein